METKNLDLGEIKSRDIGNMISKTLVDMGKEVVDNSNPTYDYGDLPSRALPELGKQALANQSYKKSRYEIGILLNTIY